MLFFDAIVPKPTINAGNLALVDKSFERFLERRIGRTAEAREPAVIFGDRLATLVHGRDQGDVNAGLDSAHSTRAAQPIGREKANPRHLAHRKALVSSLSARTHFRIS